MSLVKSQFWKVSVEKAKLIAEDGVPEIEFKFKKLIWDELIVIPLITEFSELLRPRFWMSNIKLFSSFDVEDSIPVNVQSVNSSVESS